MKCSNANRGCEWVGTVGTLEKHVATCGFIQVPCPKQCRKDDNDKIKCFMQKDLEKHLKNDCPNRDHKCEHCGKKSPYAFITQVHDGKCRKKLIPCPNAGCGDTIERQQVCKHVHTKCLYAVIPCKYKGIGCDTELKRKDMAAHEQDDKIHLHLALDTVKSQQVAINYLRATVKSLQIHMVSKDKESVTFRLPEYWKKKEAKEVFQFPPFYTHPNGYHMALRVHANGYGDGEGTHVSVFARILEGEYDAGLKWPFIGSVTFTLLNQIKDTHHKTVIAPFTTEKDIRTGEDWGYHDFIPHSALAHNPVKNTQYLKDDKLYFKIFVEVTDRKPWLDHFC